MGTNFFNVTVPSVSAFDAVFGFVNDHESFNLNSMTEIPNFNPSDFVFGHPIYFFENAGMIGLMIFNNEERPTIISPFSKGFDNTVKSSNQLFSDIHITGFYYNGSIDNNGDYVITESIAKFYIQQMVTGDATFNGLSCVVYQNGVIDLIINEVIITNRSYLSNFFIMWNFTIKNTGFHVYQQNQTFHNFMIRVNTSGQQINSEDVLNRTWTPFQLTQEDFFNTVIPIQNVISISRRFEVKNL